MLRVYEEALVQCRELVPVLKAIESKDRDLGRQLRRTLASVPLNLAEGAGSRGGNKRARYATALGSADEVKACLQVALALGCVDAVDEALLDRLDKIARTINRLARR